MIRASYSYKLKFNPIVLLVGAVYSGIVATARHFARILDFIIEPSGVTIEQTWNGTGASNAFSLSITPAVVQNACLVACVDGLGNMAAPTSMTWNSITLARQVKEDAILYAGTAIYAAVIPAGSLGVASNLATVGGSFDTAYVTAYLCSGVHQATPVIATGTAPGSASEPHSITMAASVANGMAIECGILSGSPYFGAVGAGQTAQPDTTTPYGSYKATTGASAVMTHTLTNALSRNSMSAIALQPA